MSLSEGRFKGQAERGWAGNRIMGGQGGWVKPRPLLINIVVVNVLWSSSGSWGN